MTSTVTKLYETSNVCIQLVSVPRGESRFLQRHEAQHSLAIPLNHLEQDVPYPVLINYLLHHVPPNTYYSLHGADSMAETFVQLLWSKKA